MVRNNYSCMYQDLQRRQNRLQGTTFPKSDDRSSAIISFLENCPRNIIWRRLCSTSYWVYRVIQKSRYDSITRIIQVIIWKKNTRGSGFFSGYPMVTLTMTLTMTSKAKWGQIRFIVIYSNPYYLWRIRKEQKILRSI